MPLNSQGRGFEVGTFKRGNVEMNGFVRRNKTVFIHFDGTGGQFQQSVGARIKACGFDVDNHGEVAAKTGRITDVLGCQTGSLD